VSSANASVQVVESFVLHRDDAGQVVDLILLRADQREQIAGRERRSGTRAVIVLLLFIVPSLLVRGQRMRVRTRPVVPPGVGGAVMLVGACGRTWVKRRGYVSRARSSARIRPDGVTRRLRSSTVSGAAVSGVLCQDAA
jgi:hypothetical protein